MRLQWFLLNILHITEIKSKFFNGQNTRSTERMGQIFDWDGTITSQAMSMIVRDQPFYTSSWCEARPHWGNMSICPHRYVNAAGYGSGFQHKGKR